MAVESKLAVDRREALALIGAVAIVGTIAGTIKSASSTRGVQVTDRVASRDGIEIATQAFGDPTHPTVLLIMGSMASMLWWPDEFCELLAARNLFVIRYDNRDTGLSTIYPPGTASYTLNDMADDAVRVLDAWDITAAHIVGMSLGGMIAQVAALQQPGRSLSLTLISTSAIGADAAGLPPPDPDYLSHAAKFETLDWQNRDEVIRLIVADAREVAGSAHSFDEHRARSLIERDYDRARNFASVINHWSVAARKDWPGRSSDLTIPPVVIHGTDDPIYPYVHGAKLAKAARAKRLVRVNGGGHELHPANWGDVTNAIADQASSDR